MNAPVETLVVRPGSKLHLDIQFAEFYRTRLRPVTGARVRSSELLAAHAAWAASGLCGSIGFKQLKRLMRERGHRHFYSDSAWYADVAIRAADDVGTTDVIGSDDERRYELSYALDLVARLDTIAAELATIRARVVEAIS